MARRFECLKKACDLCPASRYQEMTRELVAKMVSHIFNGCQDNADTEEEEEPPLECQPYWFGDDEPSDVTPTPPQQSAATEPQGHDVKPVQGMRIEGIIILAPATPAACCPPCGGGVLRNGKGALWVLSMRQVVRGTRR